MSDFTIQVDEPNVFSVTEQPAANVTVTGGGGVISSVFGRIGAIAALSGDYSAFYDTLGAAAAVTTTSIGAVPTSRTLTINSTALDLTANRSWTVGDALVGSPLSQFAATTSTQLRGVLSDENGTGAALFDGATSPTFVSPSLGTPTTLVGTNITGTAAGLTAGNATLAATVTTNANLTGPITSSGNATSVAAQTGTGSTFVMSAGSPTIATPSFTTGFTIGGAAAAGKIPIGNGTNYVASTPTYPNAAGTSGNILQSDGTNWSSVLPPNILRVSVKGLTIQTAGTPVDIGTITVPSYITRYTTPGFSGTYMIYAETAAGTLAGASVTLRDAAGGGGQAISASTACPTGAGALNVSTGGNLVSTSATISVRQTSNSVNAGTCSFYIAIFPLP